MVRTTGTGTGRRARVLEDRRFSTSKVQLYRARILRDIVVADLLKEGMTRATHGAPVARAMHTKLPSCSFLKLDVSNLEANELA